MTPAPKLLDQLGNRRRPQRADGARFLPELDQCAITSMMSRQVGLRKKLYLEVSYGNAPDFLFPPYHPPLFLCDSKLHRDLGFFHRNT